jgi:hypothetical protein
MGTKGGSQSGSYNVPLPRHRHGSGANKKPNDSNVYGGTKSTPYTNNSMAGDANSTTGWWTEYEGEESASITVDRRQPYQAIGYLYARY